MRRSPEMPPLSNRLPRELLQLAQLIADLPPEQQQAFEPVYAQVVSSVHRRRRILALVNEALSQLRLDVKYLSFDLEATRRERDELRRQLEEAEGSGGGHAADS